MGDVFHALLTFLLIKLIGALIQADIYVKTASAHGS
jgi:hypothetical protein